jgi:UDP-glucose:(heptosyl)LPS alpha-1,3-glucosyltransferase
VKIALVHKRLDLKGGTERDLYQTAKGLRDLGHEVHLFCSEFGIAAPEGTVGHVVPVIRLERTLRLWSFIALKHNQKSSMRRRCWLGENVWDVLRSSGGTHPGTLRMGQQRGAAHKAWQYWNPYHLSLLQIEKRQYSDRRLQRIIAVSDEVRHDIETNYPVANDKVTVLYNGVDHERFHPSRRAAMRECLRARWNVREAVVVCRSGFAQGRTASWQLGSFG